MSWRFEWSPESYEQYRRLDKGEQSKIDRWVTKHVNESENPQAYGHNLRGVLSHLWRYRVGDYRLLCTFDGDELIVLCLELEHRSTVYDERRHKRS